LTNGKDLINKVGDILDFLKANVNSIDFKKIKNEISKLDSKLKSSLMSDERVKNLFSDKTLFTNLTEIKTFMSNNFKIEIKERSTAGILSNITYYITLDETLFPKIQNKVSSIKLKQPIVPVKRTPSRRKKKVITDKSWKDWTQYKRDELREHLEDLTIAQIKSLSGKLLTSSEKNVRKANLIENVIKRIIRLETHYGMGPG